jgi:hypothetical protein
MDFDSESNGHRDIRLWKTWPHENPSDSQADQFLAERKSRNKMQHISPSFRVGFLKKKENRTFDLLNVITPSDQPLRVEL